MSGAVTEELSALRKRVEQWRRHRTSPRELIPQELWDAAVEVAGVQGVYATCRALRFNYSSLKARMPEGSEEGGAKSEGETFVEVAMGALGSGGKTVVELMGQRGGRMRIEVSGPSSVDIAAVVQAFWSGER